MYYSLLSVHMGLQLCLVAMVAVGGLFLYRHTGLSSVLWLSIYLATSFIVTLFQPMLTKVWGEPLSRLWQSGHDFPWQNMSLAQAFISLSYALSFPFKVAALFVTLMVFSDMIQLLDRLGIQSNSLLSSRLLTIQKNHFVWGAMMLCFIALVPIFNWALSYYIESLIGNYSLASP